MIPNCTSVVHRDMGEQLGISKLGRWLTQSVRGGGGGGGGGVGVLGDPQQHIRGS